MTDPIQRYTGLGEMRKSTHGLYVLAAEAAAHEAAAVAAARAEWEVVAQDVAYNATEIGRKQGQRDALTNALAAIRALPKPWARAYMDTEVESAIQRLIDAAPQRVKHGPDCRCTPCRTEYGVAAPQDAG